MNKKVQNKFMNDIKGLFERYSEEHHKKVSVNDLINSADLFIEREKIIKKTVELVAKDISKIMKPVKAVLAGVVCGASSFFLNTIGGRVRKWFVTEIFTEEYSAKSLLEATSNITLGFLIIYFIIGMIAPFFLDFIGVGPFSFLKMKIGIKFLLITNLIGFIGEVGYYIVGKKGEAELLLKKKEKPEDIKIDGKKKEPPKIVGRVNT